MARTKKTEEPVPSETGPAPEDSAVPAAEVLLDEPARSPAVEVPVTEPPLQEPPRPRMPPAPPRRRGLSVVVGGVLAALAGSAATIYALPRLPEQLSSAILPADAPNAAAYAAHDEAIAALTGQIDDLKAATGAPDLSAITGQVDAAVATLTTRLDAVDAALLDITGKVSALDDRLTALEKRPVSGGAVSSTAVDALSRELADLRAQIAAGGGDAGAVKAEIEAAAKAATDRISAAEEEAARLAAESAEAARQATRNAAISHLEAAIESGAPIDAALADLTASGLTIPAALTDQSAGVPSMSMLRDAFAAAARDALVISIKETAGEGFWSRVGAFLRSQSGARSLTPRAGTDPDAILSRAEASLAAGDIAAAIAELQDLPEGGKARMAEWTALAERRLAAVKATADLAATQD